MNKKLINTRAQYASAQIEKALSYLNKIVDAMPFDIPESIIAQNVVSLLNEAAGDLTILKNRTK